MNLKWSDYSGGERSGRRMIQLCGVLILLISTQPGVPSECFSDSDCINLNKHNLRKWLATSVSPSFFLNTPFKNEFFVFFNLSVGIPKKGLEEPCLKLQFFSMTPSLTFFAASAFYIWKYSLSVCVDWAKSLDFCWKQIAEEYFLQENPPLLLLHQDSLLKESKRFVFITELQGPHQTSFSLYEENQTCSQTHFLR